MRNFCESYFGAHMAQQHQSDFLMARRNKKKKRLSRRNLFLLGIKTSQATLYDKISKNHLAFWSSTSWYYDDSGQIFKWVLLLPGSLRTSGDRIFRYKCKLSICEIVYLEDTIVCVHFEIGFYTNFKEILQTL